MLKSFFIGLIIGVVSGLFGAGGGLILLPILNYFFQFSEKESRATTIFCILPLSIVSAILYFKNYFFDWYLVLKIILGGIIGAYIGSKLLKKLPDKILKMIFIIFLAYFSMKYITV